MLRSKQVELRSPTNLLIPNHRRPAAPVERMLDTSGGYWVNEREKLSKVNKWTIFRLSKISLLSHQLRGYLTS